MKKSTVAKEEKRSFEVKVIRAHSFSDTRTGFDMVVNGVTINGCVFVEFENGDLINFPSYPDKSGAKDEKGKLKYWNHCWFPANDKDIKADIKSQIEKLL